MVNIDELRRLADEVVLKDWRKRSAGSWKEKWVENERGHEVVRGAAEQTAAISFIAAANPAVVLALLDLLAAAESRCAALDEAIMRLNAEHLDDVQRLTRERGEAEQRTAERIAARLDAESLAYGKHGHGLIDRLASLVRTGAWRDDEDK